MVDCTIDGTSLICKVRGWHKLWAFASRFRFPLSHIKKVYQDPSVHRKFWVGFRMLGTNLPFILTAGTFLYGKEWTFWDVRNPEKAVVIELVEERFSKMIVEVENPRDVVVLLTSAISMSDEKKS